MGAHGLTPSSTMGAQIACQLGAERGNQRAKKIRKHLTRCGRGVRWGGGWRGLDPEGTGIGGSRELMGSARRARLWPWTLPKVAPAFPISCFPVLVLRSSGAPWALFPISFFRSSFVFLAPHPTQLPESKMGTSKTFVPRKYREALLTLTPNPQAAGKGPRRALGQGQARAGCGFLEWWRRGVRES